MTPLIRNIIQEIHGQFTERANKEVATWHCNYMRNQFTFCGISSPVRKKIVHQYLQLTLNVDELLSLITQLAHGKYREEFYIAIDIFNYYYRDITSSKVRDLYSLIELNPWWDTIDALQKPFSKYEDDLEEMIQYFNKQSLFWYRRMAIILQLKRKENTNTDLLASVILNNQDDNEFFIQKSIGWALREYSKTNPQWVRMFLQNTKLSSLAIREASKYLK